MTVVAQGEVGVGQWFHYEAYEDLERAVGAMRQLGVRHLRTGISWADYHRPGGKAWYDHQMKMLAEFEVLLSIWHTPPSIAEGSRCAGPPRRLEDYADFIGEVIDRYGDSFADLELWNEPNNHLKWDFRIFDPRWEKFSRMIAAAAKTAHSQGKRTVLGGMIPVDPAWLRLVRDHGALEDIDVVAIHGFPGMWWPNHPNWDWYNHWKGWDEKVAKISAEAGGRSIWITEAGLATWDLDEARPARHHEQCVRLNEAARAPCERLYWYSLIDLDPRREAIEGFHVDENEYHLGLVRYDGSKKPAWDTFRSLLQDERKVSIGAAAVAF